MSDTLLTVNQAADHLNLRPSTLRAWILRRKIGYVKVGRAVRIRLADLEGVIQAGTVPAAADK